MFFFFQLSSTVIYFTNILWPEFTIWHLLSAIFYYQRHYNTLQSLKIHLDDCSDKPRREPSDVIVENNITIFLEKFEKRKYEELLNLTIDQNKV